jgi:hypothetical protein
MQAGNQTTECGKMKRLTPHDQLASGQSVSIPGYIGVVLKADCKRDQHGGPIIVHTLKLTHKTILGIAGHVKRELLFKPITKQCNYSFINVLA